VNAGVGVWGEGEREFPKARITMTITVENNIRGNLFIEEEVVLK